MFYENDYLRGGTGYNAAVREENGILILSNGLAECRFATRPDFARISLVNLLSGEQFLRAVKPEVTLTIDGVKYPVGGVTGQFEYGFLKPEWMEKFTASDGFRFTHYEAVPYVPERQWKRKRRATAQQPAGGACLRAHFASDQEELRGISVCVEHILYDGVPALGKRFTLENHSDREVLLNACEVEILAVAEHETYDTEISSLRPRSRNLFATSSIENRLRPTCHFEKDPDYTSQVDYLCDYPCLLVSAPPIGPHRRIAAGASFSSYTAYLLLFDETDLNRRALQYGAMYRALAPWTTENPIFLHVISNDEAVVRAAVDQCVETGFEMVILSFGSGLEMEDASPKNIAKYKAMADYAHSRGIELGGYSLLASRDEGAENNVQAESIIFGNSPCLGSQWGIRYLKNLRSFMEQTGFDVLEHDGSYPGDFCRATRHPGHEGYEDSQYTQLMAIADLYHWCRARGVYLNVPDHYYMAGNNKCFMGYKEVNWSLPREQQALLARQNLYDGTWEKLPTMGWMFVPLEQYHGGGEAATVEPLCEHLDHYRTMMLNNLLYGAQAAYRGKRLYDTEETKAMVQRSIATYKAHRDILESPLIHLRRPDGRDWDGILHVAPGNTECGLAAFFNPLPHPITRHIRLPLYYTGCGDKAEIALFGENAQTYALDRGYCVTLDVTIPARDCVWYTIRA